MRKKLDPAKKCKAMAISLSPRQTMAARARSFKAQISVSRYFQLLAELDERENILPRALVAGLAVNPDPK